MTPILGYDASWSPPDPVCAAKAGMRFAIRYTQPDDPAKSLDHAEAVALVEAGLQMVAVHQPSGDKGWMLAGYDRGVKAARDALSIARDQAGWDPGRAIYYPLDTDPNTLSIAEWDQVRRCLDGAASVTGFESVGIYGGRLAIERCRAHAAWLWQTYAWSGGVWVTGVHLQQYQNNVSFCGGVIDRDRAMAADFGQWDDP
jgi:hypothetical protein